MKLNTKFRRPSASMVIATTALVIAAGGAGAYAQSQINGSQLVNKSVKNAKIANQAINNRTLASNSVLASTLAPGAISTRFREQNSGSLPSGQQTTIYIACQSNEDIVGGGFGGIYPTSAEPGHPRAATTRSAPCSTRSTAATLTAPPPPRRCPRRGALPRPTYGGARCGARSR